MSQTSSQADGAPSEVVTLKRQLAVLEPQNAELRKQPAEEKSECLCLEGQVIHRLVCLTDHVKDHIAEFDRRVMLGIDLDDDTSLNDPEDNRKYRSYKKLVTWCPSICCGFNNDATGWLICPVDYDWNDPVVQQGIRDYHPDYHVTAHSWPAFLYQDEKYDPLKPVDGLFKGKLLLKTFKYTFTSPTSAEMDNQEQLDPEMLSWQGCPKQ
ncbi:uncharacterized protein EDB91DRAFT_1246984 [Suillus paluster]|uniref:uncharacterized protein n=1 Tax=Suillus paluster TaxID=48578 RepID=UPI001B882E69|nr:uncharacterized protein EDB91DRAFT_1246984 [Suillus paluster]KAG1744104.1 hypothetical protein EDB91DRAFT_1246984 [Suillus paluster]